MGWRLRAVRDILEVTGRVSGRARCLQESAFLFKKNVGNNCEKCVSLSNNAICNPLERKKLDIACFRKVLKTLGFYTNFVSPNCDCGCGCGCVCAVTVLVVVVVVVVMVSAVIVLCVCVLWLLCVRCGVHM